MIGEQWAAAVTTGKSAYMEHVQISYLYFSKTAVIYCFALNGTATSEEASLSVSTISSFHP